MMNAMIAFGPVPSRRLGRSLGINNIPPKQCTYSCLYCQVGLTGKMQIERGEYYGMSEILEDVQIKVDKAKLGGESIDYLTFVPDGEPTLDINLGREIKMLRSFGIKVAVITNSSLLWREDVRRDLMNADLVSVKVDSVREKIWRYANRAHHSLSLDIILEGISEFSKIFKGELVTESMLLKGINDGEEHLGEIASYLSSILPAKSYLAIPIRPPADSRAQVPDEANINQAFQIFSNYLDNVEYLIGYEGNAFAHTGNVEEDLLSITGVHPMREDAVVDYLDRSNADREIIKRLIAEGKLTETRYRGKKYYLRKFNSP